MSLKELEKRIDTLENTQTLRSQAGIVKNPEWIGEYEDAIKRETGRDSDSLTLEEIFGTQAYREYERRVFNELVRQVPKP